MEVKIEIRIVKVNERATDGKVRPVMSKPDRGMYMIKLQGPGPQEVRRAEKTIIQNWGKKIPSILFLNSKAPLERIR